MAGRPKSRINLAELGKLANLHCTDEEIADFFGVSAKTIQRRKEEPKFLAALDHGRALGKVSLRRVQFAAALAGDRTMMIWLGKQLLGQRSFEKVEPAAAEASPEKVTYQWVPPKQSDPPSPESPAPPEEPSPGRSNTSPSPASGDSTT